MREVPYQIGSADRGLHLLLPDIALGPIRKAIATAPGLHTFEENLNYSYRIATTSELRLNRPYTLTKQSVICKILILSSAIQNFTPRVVRNGRFHPQHQSLSTRESSRLLMDGK
jgi:hypothetical protein